MVPRLFKKIKKWIIDQKSSSRIQTDADGSSKERETPMMEFPSGPPAGSIEEIQQKAWKIHAGIAEKKEHRYGGSDEIEIPDDDTTNAKEGSEESCEMRLTPFGDFEVF